MSTLEKRLTDLEAKIKPDEGPVLMIMCNTTFEEAKADYERQAGQTITNEAFKQRLPDLSKIIFTLHTNEGISENAWIGPYCRNGR